MATEGIVTYQQFITKLIDKASNRPISVSDAEKIGTFFWGLLSEEAKQADRKQWGRNAFWMFALWLKDDILEKKSEELFNLWESFDQNGQNLWQNMYRNTIQHQVDQIL